MREAELLPERESGMEKLREMGLGEHFAASTPDFVDKVYEHMQNAYGRLPVYPERIGRGHA
ncbi:hypothetical protein MMC08_001579 [Hypocenomyce scalaris]|nr:hypothetical protein [Hypocenomyce scalaris]